LGMQESYLIALKSSKMVYINPQKISYFVIDDTGNEERTR